MNKQNSEDVMPTNSVVQALLTDLYQVTMAYAYWKSGKMEDKAVFDLFFRKNPFKGEFAIFAGLSECLKFLSNFRFSDSDINYLKQILPHVDPQFWEYLSGLDASQVTMSAIPEGYVVFPKVPLIRLEGPLPVIQLLETTLLNLVNYASLVATNAARFRITAGESVQLLEFGLRRAQGPDGGLSASKYCYIGGFDGTSNVLAGKLFGIPVRGTHAHAFVNSFSSLDEIKGNKLVLNPLAKSKKDPQLGFVELTKSYLNKISPILNVLENETNEGELTAFLSYAFAFPTSCLCLLDTYSVIKSGLPNFLAVALALNDYGYRVIGVRLDSGDLAYLSRKCREGFNLIADKFGLPWIKQLIIVASNDINEDTLRSLKEQACFGSLENHEINSFGIGTHLVTCQKQPALGCVFKLVEVNGEPRMKLSEDVEKINLPGKKNVFRLYSEDGLAILDLIQLCTEKPPAVGKKILVRHPFNESKRAYVCPHKVELLYTDYWGDNCLMQSFSTLQETKQIASDSLKTLRQDIKRELNPTPYKVSVTNEMYHFLHDLWLKHAPIGELS
uniref:nicotinate phosphoribosyltransferase-like protein isoform X1 n=1 Tax=Ciona intestinalis TaxID=7719 RepID=UPI000521B698|nr:nicotinate phosphoribosyltransferase-like protein isoform X1 [Ciona intestinalis]|eukprot:XP_009857496.1 nicotinate phosphoribosyltransferase-like protein isoform X1 [Ciona intestinalis]